LGSAGHCIISNANLSHFAKDLHVNSSRRWQLRLAKYPHARKSRSGLHHSRSGRSAERFRHKIAKDATRFFTARHSF